MNGSASLIFDTQWYIHTHVIWPWLMAAGWGLSNNTLLIFNLSPLSDQPSLFHNYILQMVFSTTCACMHVCVCMLGFHLACSVAGQKPYDNQALISFSLHSCLHFSTFLLSLMPAYLMSFFHPSLLPFDTFFIPPLFFISTPYLLYILFFPPCFLSFFETIHLLFLHFTHYFTVCNSYCITFVIL